MMSGRSSDKQFSLAIAARYSLASRAEPHATLVEPDRLAVVMLRAGLVLCALARFARSNTFVNVSSFDQLQNAVFAAGTP